MSDTAGSQAGRYAQQRFDEGAKAWRKRMAPRVRLVIYPGDRVFYVHGNELAAWLRERPRRQNQQTAERMAAALLHGTTGAVPLSPDFRRPPRDDEYDR